MGGEKVEEVEDVRRRREREKRGEGRMNNRDRWKVEVYHMK